MRAASRLRARTKSAIASGLRQSTKFVDQQRKKPVSVEAASVSTGESGVSAERAVVAAGCKLWTCSCARRWRSRTNGGPGDNPAQRAQVSSSAHAPSISVGRRSRRACQRRGQRGAAPYGDRVLVYAKKFLYHSDQRSMVPPRAPAALAPRSGPREMYDGAIASYRSLCTEPLHLQTC